MANSLRIAEKFIFKNAIKKFLRASAGNLIYKESVLKLFIVGYHNSATAADTLYASWTPAQIFVCELRSEARAFLFLGVVFRYSQRQPH